MAQKLKIIIMAVCMAFAGAAAAHSGSSQHNTGTGAGKSWECGEIGLGEQTPHSHIPGKPIDNHHNSSGQGFCPPDVAGENHIDVVCEPGRCRVERTCELHRNCP